MKSILSRQFLQQKDFFKDLNSSLIGRNKVFKSIFFFFFFTQT